MTELKEGINVRMGLNHAKFHQGLQAVSGSIGQFAARATKLLLSPQVAIAALGFAAVKAISKANAEFMKFEERVAEIGTIVDTTQYSMKTLQETALELSTSLGFSATDTARAMYQAVSAGREIGNITEFMGTAAKLAQGGFIELETSVMVLSKTLNAYKSQALSANASADIMFKTVEKGIITMQQLSGVVGRYSTIAAEMGIKFSDIQAAMATLTKSGLNAFQSATSLRSIMMQILDPTDDAKKAMREYGVDMTAAGVRARGLVGTMELLSAKLKGNNAALAKLLPNTRAYTGALILMSRIKGYRAIYGEMRTAGGTAAEAAEKRKATLAWQNQMLQTKMKNTWIEMGKNMQSVNQEWLRMKAGAVDLFNTVFGKFDLLGRAILVVQSLWRSFSSMATLALAAIIRSVGYLIQAFNFLWQAVKGVADLFASAFNAILGGVSVGLAFVLNLVENVLWQMGKIPGLGWLQDWSDDVGAAREAVADFAKISFESSAENWAASMDKFTTSIDAFDRKAGGLGNDLIDFGDRLQEQSDWIYRLADLAAQAAFAPAKLKIKLQQEIDTIRDMLEKGVPSEEIHKALEELEADYKAHGITIRERHWNNYKAMMDQADKWLEYMDGKLKTETQTWMREYQKRANLASKFYSKIKALEEERYSNRTKAERTLYNLRTRRMKDDERILEAQKMYNLYAQRAKTFERAGAFDKAKAAWAEAATYLVEIASSGDKVGAAQQAAYNALEQLYARIDKIIQAQQAQQKKALGTVLAQMKTMEKQWRHLMGVFAQQILVKVDAGEASKEVEEIQKQLKKMFLDFHNKIIKIRVQFIQDIQGRNEPIFQVPGGAPRYPFGGTPTQENKQPQSTGRSPEVSMNVDIHAPEMSREEVRNYIVNEINLAIQRRQINMDSLGSTVA